MSQVPGDDHYKRMTCVTVGVARWRILTAQWPWVPSIGQNLKSFIGNDDISKVKNSRVERKNTNKQIQSRTIRLFLIHGRRLCYATIYTIKTPISCTLIQISPKWEINVRISLQFRIIKRCNRCFEHYSIQFI